MIYRKSKWHRIVESFKCDESMIKFILDFYYFPESHIEVFKDYYFNGLTIQKICDKSPGPEKPSYYQIRSILRKMTDTVEYYVYITKHNLTK